MAKSSRKTWQTARVLVLVANAGGIDAARALVRHFGGRQLYVPRNAMPDNHELVVAIGRAAAEVLRDAYGGEILIVPVGRDLRLDIAAEAVEKSGGRARNAIVQALGCSYWTAKRILRRLKKDVPRDATVPTKAARRRDPRQIDLEDLL